MTASAAPAAVSTVPAPAAPAPSHDGRAASLPPAPAAAIDAQWLATFQQLQQQTAETHAAFQRAMFDSHAAYLQVAESALLGLGAMTAPVALPPPVRTEHTGIREDVRPHAAVDMPAVTAQAAPAARMERSPIREDARPHAVADVAAVPVAAGPDLHALMLSVVAEKTGYPTDMLDLGMDLEGDLGIDSIKRVEILAAVSERAPGMPKVDRAHLSGLHTLGEIAGYLQQLGGAGTAERADERPNAVHEGMAVDEPRMQRSAIPERIAAAPLSDLRALMLAVVAEKTGYPSDMLDLGMDLEGDLGIDSIKRVEILAAVSERAPGMPKVDRAHLSGLHTLGEIVGYLQQLGGAGAAAPCAVPVTRNAGPDLRALMLAVVAEKTGYPSDMLDLGMDLEGDLGIDSIKRVEILAAVSERAPDMPKVDRAHLSGLHTLGEIVGYLQQLAGTATVDAVPMQSSEIRDEAATARDSIASTLGRYALRRIAAPATGLALPGLRDGAPVYVTGGSAVDAALVAELAARGVDARNVSVLPADATACIYTGGLRDVADADAAIAINRDAFATARTLAANIADAAGVFVTVQDTGGAFATDDPVRAWLTGMPALVKTAALEWPRAAVKAIDLQRHARNPATLARVLADELLAGGGEVEVGLTADGERNAWGSVPVAIERFDAVVGSGDVVVVTGGARGVTAGCIVEWARDCRAKFVLLGRTALQDEPACCAGVAEANDLKRVLLQAARDAGRQPTPNELQQDVDRVLGNREIRGTLAAIAAAGGQARYAAVDVTDAKALDALLADVRAQWGPVAALVHAAGVLADRRIADKTDAQFERVFATKVGGLRALLRATARDPLKLLCAFSSVSARCGNTGQADYAMANEVLNKVLRAEAQRRSGLRTRSLGWGPWEGGMVTPALRERFAALGVPMIPLQAGARMFADEMRSADADVEWVLGGKPAQDVLLSAGAEQRVQALEVHLSRASHGWLSGHAVGAVPVVPVVLAAEWMTRAVRSFHPGTAVAALHDLRVLKGIRLVGFDGEGDRYRIELVPLHGEHAGQLQVTILDAAGVPRYRARAESGPTARAAEAGLPSLALDAWNGAPLYGDLLFHRGSFELITQVDGISDNGVGATLRGVDHAGWRHEPWHLDVAALDGGLQMAVLYGQRMLGGPSLPTAVDEIRCFGTAPSKGLITAAAYRRRVGDAAVTTDILFADQHGVRIAELRGVQNHRLPQAG